MNLRHLIIFSFFAAGPLLAGTTNIYLKVHLESENQTVDKKAVEETRAHWLQVRVTNGSSLNLEGLTLRWKLYAANLQRGKDDILVEKSGESKFALASGKYADITTSKVAFKHTPQHSEKTSSGGSSSRAKYKTVPESGHRYHGYSVEVLDPAGTVIGEFYSNQSLRHLNE